MATKVFSLQLQTHKGHVMNVSFLHLLSKCTGGLTVGLLVTSTGSRSTELLGLAATWVGDQQGPVVLDQDVFDLFLGSLIDICHNNKSNRFGEEGIRTTLKTILSI